MENQHRQISGYRELDEHEVQLMNEIKAKAVEVGTLCAKLEMNRTVDMRWVNIGKTSLQEGFMFLTRAVARPTTF